MRKQVHNMLKSHNFCLLKDNKGDNDVEVEINFDKKQPDVIKMVMGGKTAVINKRELYSMTLLIADEIAQEELMPVNKIDVTQFTRSIRLKAEKDIKKGEEIIANVEIEVPTYLKKKFKGLKNPKKGRVKGRNKT